MSDQLGVESRTQNTLTPVISEPLILGIVLDYCFNKIFSSLQRGNVVSGVQDQGYISEIKKYTTVVMLRR